ncbi:hypothetical protein Patl1_15329 [Pistacia atlantica]|uniref:Uncharacterized protein n=1 Tax=Pistacia atlantica TaxID=434234 RepID=A0ACC1B7V1_9ROSI|nr:hypothetical protein Patl1_15329 [Pistacia atlantica]
MFANEYVDKNMALVITLPNMSSRHKRFPSDAMNKKYTVDKTIRDGKYGLIGNGVKRDTAYSSRDSSWYRIFAVQNCVHEDLRPEFVLFDPDSKKVKVAYFGEPKGMDDLVNDWCLDNPAASLYYQAPEILFNGSSKVVDIYINWDQKLGSQFLILFNKLENFSYSVLGESKLEVYGKIEITIDGLLTLSKNFDYKDLTKEFSSLEPTGVDLISISLI